MKKRLIIRFPLKKWLIIRIITPLLLLTQTIRHLPATLPARPAPKTLPTARPARKALPWWTRYPVNASSSDPDPLYYAVLTYIAIIYRRKYIDGSGIMNDAGESLGKLLPMMGPAKHARFLILSQRLLPQDVDIVDLDIQVEVDHPWDYLLFFFRLQPHAFLGLLPEGVHGCSVDADLLGACLAGFGDLEHGRSLLVITVGVQTRVVLLLIARRVRLEIGAGHGLFSVALLRHAVSLVVMQHIVPASRLLPIFVPPQLQLQRNEHLQGL
jgi:hypothetical protein